MYFATHRQPEFKSEINNEIGAGVGEVLAGALDYEIQLYEEGKLQ